MSEAARIARQAFKGLPYLDKELRRRISLGTGRVIATPSIYYIIFSGRCNIACPYCEIYKHVDPTLSRDVVCRIIREAQELSRSGFNVQMSGGEPMIYRPLYDVLALTHELGINFGFTTNGHALTKSNVAKILAFDPFNINVSLDSVDPKINEWLRPLKDGTRRTLQGIENIVTEKERIGARVGLFVKPTIMDQNYRSLPDLVRYFGKDSKIQINFQPYVGASLNNPFFIKDLDAFAEVVEELVELKRSGYPIVGQEASLRQFIEYFSDPPPAEDGIRHFDLGGQKRNCDIGLRSMFVYPNGDVHFCDFLKQAIGNVHEQSLREIYYGMVANGQRRGMVYCNIDCQQVCKRPVPLWEKAQSFLRMG
jgi:MoaA/NifB/PqqE/SkfB family radical SAM enzyme